VNYGNGAGRESHGSTAGQPHRRFLVGETQQRQAAALKHTPVVSPPADAGPAVKGKGGDEQGLTQCRAPLRPWPSRRETSTAPCRSGGGAKSEHRGEPNEVDKAIRLCYQSSKRPFCISATLENDLRFRTGHRGETNMKELIETAPREEKP
jgi:hypothetical protein